MSILRPNVLLLLSQISLYTSDVRAVSDNCLKYLVGCIPPPPPPPPPYPPSPSSSPLLLLIIIIIVYLNTVAVSIFHVSYYSFS